MRRQGHTYRIHDFGPLTIACGSNWVCDGHHRWPKIDLILRDRLTKKSCTGGRALVYRRLSIPLPYIKWHVGFEHRSLRPLQRMFDRLYRNLFVTRREA